MNNRDGALDVLFEPLEMPNLNLKNRFFMAPMGTTFGVDQYTDFLVARAKGEVALIHAGEFSVHRSGRAGMAKELCLEKDDDIRIISPMVKAVQKAGAKVIAQLNHCGRYCFSRTLGQQSVAPSPIASLYTGETPRELSTQDTDDMVIAFADAAVRAREAGFDGVEFMGSSGYLISQFLSPLTNKRDDRYGGDTLGRGRFLFSILKETRNRVGYDFDICVKFDVEDGMKGGKTLEDSLILAPKMVEAGANRLHAWAGWHESPRPMLPMFVQRGAFSYLAAAIKKVVDVPVSTVGRFNDPYVAADILSRGDADLIGLGRTLLADPDFVKKTRESRDREIRRCTACCSCLDNMMLALRGDDKAALKCAINPELGFEGKNLVKKAAKAKHVAVIGAGPAGMEIARLSSFRGHRVTLFERDEKVGGMLKLACIPPHKEELKNVIDYYTNIMETMNIDLRLGEAFNPDMIKKMKPDAVVIATGAEPSVPDIVGVGGKNVVTALEVLKGNVVISDPVVVIGGGLIGVETAEYMADLGKEVAVIEMLKSVAKDIGPTMRWSTVKRIGKKARILTSTKVTEIREGSVVVIDNEGDRKEIPASTVVLAAGLTSQSDLVEVIDRSGCEYHVIGSCRKPGQIAEAISEAFSLGCKL